jgi:hypothetical protein
MVLRHGPNCATIDAVPAQKTKERKVTIAAASNVAFAAVRYSRCSCSKAFARSALKNE